MAAFGHIFEKPLSEPPMFLESLSPWKHIKNPLDDSSFTEIFGELHFKEKDNNHLNGYYPSKYGSSEAFCSKNSESLSLCTEGLGFESFDDVEDSSNHDEKWEEKSVGAVRSLEQQNHHRFETSKISSRTSTGEFPPPISCIGRSGKPWVCFKSFREDGRFILKEIRIPTQEFLHACRENGRLKLHFIHSESDDDILQESESESEQEQNDDDDDNQETDWNKNQKDDEQNVEKTEFDLKCTS